MVSLHTPNENRPYTLHPYTLLNSIKLTSFFLFLLKAYNTQRYIRIRMTDYEMKPDTGLLVASVRESDGAVKLESYPVSNNLTPQEAHAQGLKFVNPTSTEKIALWGGGIAHRFKGYAIVTTVKEIDDVIHIIEKKDKIESKRIWVAILRNLHKYTDEELNSNWEASNQAWSNWCDDAALFFAYNVVIFGKGIPAMDLPENEVAQAR